MKPEEPIQIPPPGTGAPEVHRWWTSLTSEERQRLIAEHPEQIGNLNGVPVSARSDANIAVMTRDLNRVRDIATRYRTSVDDVLGDPAKYGLSAGDITRYRNADETKKGLDHNARNDPRNPPGTTCSPTIQWHSAVRDEPRSLSATPTPQNTPP